MGEDIYYPWNAHNAPFQNINTIVTNQEIKERKKYSQQKIDNQQKIDTRMHND